MTKKSYKQALLNTSKAFRQLLFYCADECVVCGAAGKIICNECSYKMLRHEKILCLKCGRQINTGGLCHNCSAIKRPYKQGVIAFFYQDIAGDLMYDFKFNYKKDNAQIFAEELYKKINEYAWNFDIITAIPINILKLLGYGYNPPKLVAKRLSKLINIPYKDSLLKRIRYTKSMALLGNIDRMKHVSKNFRAAKKAIDGQKILLVDDVSTTGASLHFCSQLLLNNGAKVVYVAAACGDNILINTSGTNKGIV